MSLTKKFRYLHFLTHVFSILGLIWSFSSHQYGWLLIAFVCYLYAGIIGVNVSLHRFFAHQSFKTGPIRYWILLVSSFFPMLGSPAAWGSMHRFHHQHSDQPTDPHSPQYSGKFRSWFTMWPQVEMPLSTFRPFIKDRNIQFLDRHYFKFVFLYVVVLGLIDWRLVCFVFALPAVGCFHGAAAIAVIPHIDGVGGYRNHETTDNSYNNVFAWVLSLGEGWHNNHHFNAKKYRHGERWWELDPPAFFIKNFFMKTAERNGGKETV